MLRRSSFARPVYVPPPAALPRRIERSGVYSRVTDDVSPVAKSDVCRSEAYRRLVASLACKHCGIAGYSQCAHGNLGKGLALKTDDRYSFALCTVHGVADGSLVLGCHELYDQGCLFSKAVRREIEPVWAADTRRHILAAGMWPAGVPIWSDQP